MGLFGKTPQKDPKEQVREWCGSLRKEGRQLDRQIRKIRTEEEKVKRSLRDAAKQGHKDVCSILAKEIINSRKTVNKLYQSKAQLNSVEMQMKNQLDCKLVETELRISKHSRLLLQRELNNFVLLQTLENIATLRLAGSLEKSTEVMQYMQKLVKIPEIQATMQEMSKEMMKAGIIEEMMEDTFEGMEDDDMEEAAQEEVEKILFEVTKGALGQAGSVGATLPTMDTARAAEDEDEGEMESMQARLEALRS